MDLTPYLIAHWKMNETSGLTIVDSSGNGYHGTSQRDCSLLTTTGKVGTALKFSGTDYIDLGRTFATTFQSDFTIACEIKPTDGEPSGQGPNLFGTHSADYSSYIVLYHYTRLGLGVISFEFGCNNKAKLIRSPNAVFEDGPETWHFVVLTIKQFAGKITLSMYFDNQFLISGDITNGLLLEYVNGENFWIGQSNPPYYPYFDGSLDNVMIFNKALLQEERDFLYNFGYGTEDLSSGDNTLTIPHIMQFME